MVTLVIIIVAAVSIVIVVITVAFIMVILVAGGAPAGGGGSTSSSRTIAVPCGSIFYPPSICSMEIFLIFAVVISSIGDDDSLLVLWL